MHFARVEPTCLAMLNLPCIVWFVCHPLHELLSPLDACLCCLLLLHLLLLPRFTIAPSIGVVMTFTEEISGGSGVHGET